MRHESVPWRVLYWLSELGEYQGSNKRQVVRRVSPDTFPMQPEHSRSRDDILTQVIVYTSSVWQDVDVYVAAE
jgi:hypothetical protein